MLSYQHTYHAGGAADVHKHAAVCAVLGRLAEKDKPFTVLDLYAGHGVYGLAGDEARKTKEFEGGIGRLWPKRTGEVPPPVRKLLGIVEALNPDGALRRYPGSPALAQACLRPDDRLILNELHPAAHADLKRWAARDARITVHKRDGLEALTALVPPPIRRGLVLIDPSYEIKTEYAGVPETLRAAFRKWPDGTYLVWYPILADGRHGELLAGIEAGIRGDVLLCELTLDAPKSQKAGAGLRGTGLIAINPPWQFDRTMTEAGAWLAAALTRRGRHDVRWLKQG